MYISKNKNIYGRQFWIVKNSVDECCDLLATDFEELYKSDYQTPTSDALQSALNFYAKEKLTNTEKWAVITDISMLENKSYTLKHEPLVASIKSMKKQFDDMCDELGKKKNK